MSNRSIRFAVAIVAMMAAALAAIVLDRPVPADDSLPVRLPLPDSVGDSTAVVPLFCQNPDCLADVTGKPTAEGRCPRCGGDVSEMSLGERMILPADTVIARKRYSGPSGTFTVTAVISGLEQKSIHRPQQCLPAQGFTIISRGVIGVPGPGGAKLRMTRLAVRRTGNAAGRGTVYAYWFTDGSAETPYHLVRLVRMATGRITNRRAARWAYISVSTDVLSSSDDTDSRLGRFVSELYPSLALPPAPR